MSDPMYWQITNGLLAFAEVDTAASGYLPTWLAPAGKTKSTVLMSDYEVDAVSAAWSCQVVSGALTPTAASNDITVDPTFCAAGKTIPQPQQAAWTLDVDIYSQVAVDTGLDAFLFDHDAKELYFLLGLNGEVTTPTPATNAPLAIGRCIGVPVAFGGAGRTPLRTTFSLACSLKPDILFGPQTITLAAGAGASTSATYADTAAA